MATLSKTDSKRMYSWWWNSHISPKNSKWLQENLTDVDIKVKAMIKLIEEDADSFARRAEMYYKKRPELMKLVEEMYRAYRALAERYVHATGALRQAHKTMTEAFPNQVPVMPDDSSANSPYETDPQTPDSRTFDPEDLQKFEDSDGSTVTARRGLKFSDSEDGSTKTKSRTRPVSEFESDKEILLLKEALAKLENEKEAGLKKYQESLERLSKLESEISRAQEASSELANRANKAETEALKLKDALQRLKDETGPNLELYHLGLEKLAHLERLLIEQAREGENVTENLKEEIRVLKNERDQYKESFQIQSDLEKKLLETEKEVTELRERVEKAESEVEKLKGQIGKLTEEKEQQAKRHQQCLETISSLELRLKCAEEEAARLNNEINHGVSKLKSLEEQRLILERSNETLQIDLQSMVVKNTTQSQELTEKQKELGRLWTCIQEERLRFVEAETAFQTLQQLHSQSQEELRSLASELHHKAQILREIETRNHVLEKEIQKKIEENRSLNEVNLSSAVSLKELQSEIGSLKETNGKLEEEVEIRVDERNALQQEMYCLKEEINELTKNQNSILTQLADVGLNPEQFGSSVKELQVENSNLKEKWETEKTEKEDLLKKLEIMGQLLERNAVLENSLSDLGEELEGVRSKLKALEDSYQSLSKDKSTLDVEKANLLGQLQVTTDNLTLVNEKNTVLENSLFDAHVKLEVLKQKSKSLEDSCQILSDEKSVLVTEKGILLSQMESTEKILKDLEVKYTDLQSNYLSMEKERDSTLHKVEELHLSLALQNQEHLTFSKKNEKQLQNLKTQIQILQEQNRNKSKEFEKEVDKVFGSEIEIFVLMNCVKDLEEQNVSLVNDCHKLQEAVNLSESLVKVLKQEKVESQVKIKSLTDQNDRLRSGMHELLKVAGISLRGEDGESFDIIKRKFEGTNSALVENETRNDELVVQISVLVTLLKQLKTEVADLEAEKGGIQKELGVRVEKILELETEARKLSETNENLRLKVNQGDVTEERLKTELVNLHGEFSAVQEAYKTLQMENSVVLEENESLSKDKVHLNEKIRVLEKENDTLFGDVISGSILGHTLKKYLDEKHEENNGLSGDLEKLCVVNNALVEKMSMVETKLEDSRTENLRLKENLEKNERELGAVILVRDRLDAELVNGKNRLNVKEQEHEEAVQKLMILENEKMGLLEMVAGLQRENHEVKTVKDEQGKQIVKLVQDNDDLKNSIDEKDEEINRLGENLEKLLGVNNLLSREISVVEKKLEEAKTENLHVKENLEKNERELEAVILVRDQLDSELVNGKNQLHLKEQEHEESVQKLMILENEKMGLLEKLSAVQNEFKTVKDDQGKRILELEQDNNDLKKVIDEKDEEINRLGEDLQKLLSVNNMLSGEISIVEKKLEEAKTENLRVKENFEKSKRELEAVILVRDQLDSELANGNNQLRLKEQEHEEAVQKLLILENEKTGLLAMLAGVQNEFKTVKDEQGKRILELEQDNDDLKKAIDEKDEEVNRLGEDLQKLLGVNNLLSGEISMVEKKLEDSRTENLHLKENLEKSERELEAVILVRDRLDSELVEGKNQLNLKEQEHEKAVQQLMILENEKMGLLEKLSGVQNEVKTVKDEHGKQIVKFSQDTDDLKKALDEKHEEVNRLGEDLQKLLAINNMLADEMGMVEKKLKESRTENLHLKENLEKSDRELEAVTRARDQLDSELVEGNNRLHLKEQEHEEAVQQLTSLRNEKNELSEKLADLEREINEVRTIKDEQSSQILKLEEDNDRLSREQKLVREESQILEVKLLKLTEEHEKTKEREETIRSDLQKENEKTRSLETQASEVYGDLQTSSLCQILLEEKIRELTEVCLSLQEENSSKDAITESIKEKTKTLESENEDLKTNLASYSLALDSLRDSILSLENHTCIQTKLLENEEQTGGDESSSTMELHDLESKVKAIETAILEMQMLNFQEKLDSDSKLESAMKQIEELSYQKNSRKNPKSKSEISEYEVGILPKDIMLDQASECSSYGVSKRGMEGEIWETADNKTGITFRHHPTASDMSLESELGKPEKRSDDGNKRKVLERLNSDVLKLTNLQITIEDLKRKLEITGRGRRGKSMIECETLKGQLMEAESSIQKLYELNGKLVKNIESESGESEKRKKVSEQARRVSEKIGRLQLEVQKIQFVLMKLDDENDPKGKTRFLDTKKRVLLKDYLYGGGRTKATVSGRRKKSNFCACVEPSTKGD